MEDNNQTFGMDGPSRWEPGLGFVEAFAQAVRRTPEAGAVVAGATTLTYRQLDERSDALAAAIQDAVGVGPEPVALLGDHDEHVVVAFVAAAKAGRPAVVLDTTTPRARLVQVCETAGPVATLVDERYADLAAALAAEPIGGRQLPITPPEGGARSPEPTPTTSDRVLALIFTSGSTGRPKGVILGDVDFLEVCRTMSMATSGAARMGCPQPLSFFGGFGMMVLSLLFGFELHLYDPRRRGIHDMVDWVTDRALTHLSVTPHIMRSLAAQAVAREMVLDSLESIFSGGEALLVTDVELMRACTGPDCVIVNGSGSSEGWSISALAIGRDYQLPAAGQVPGGQPMTGRDVYLLDEDGKRIIEPGHTGRIVVTAENMARGYWRDPGRTAERFRTLPDGRREYDTGDLGRWNEAGELVYAGRADHMLKVRGYLVEPAEVESHIGATGEVEECVVVGAPTRREGVVQVVAYVVPNPTTWLSGAELRRRLRTELPSYMVPARIVELDHLPHNPNGKVDRLALPPVLTEATVEEDHSAVLARHRVVASICRTALGIEELGLHDDLFAMGADSLAIEEIVTALDDELGVRITSATFAEHPTVAELAELPRSHAPSLIDGVVVTLSPGGERRPVFFVAGSSGLALAFRELSHTVGKDRPVYGLQAFGLEGGGTPDLTIHRGARRYARAIRRIQPTGPYQLYGHSLGSILAYEVAKILQAEGEQVALLGLLDPAHDSMTLSPDGVLRNQRREAHRAPSAGVPGARGVLATARLRTARSRPYLTRTFWKNLQGSRFTSYWELGVAMAKRYHPSGEGLHDVRTVVHLAAATPVSSVPRFPGMFAEEPEVVLVPGDHLSMLRAPFVAELAEIINGELID